MALKTDIMKQTKELLSSGMSGAYLLWGQEEYLKRAFLSDVKKLVCPDEDLMPFNITTFDGTDDKDGILSAMASPPQFADKRLVIIYGTDFKKGGKETIDTMCAITKKAADYPELTLIIYLYSPQLDSEADAKTKLSKISKTCTCVNFEFLPREKLLKWIYRHFVSEGMSVSQNAAALIADRACCDMSIISNEISKLCAYLRYEGLNEPTEEIIRNITCEKNVFEAFYISNRILKRDVEGVLSYLTDALNKGTDAFMLISELTSEAERLYRIKSAMKSGLKSAEISSRIGMHEYAVKLRMQAVKDISGEYLFSFLEKCYQTDLSVKTSVQDVKRALTTLAANL